ncbi:SDR family oxidoreductase [Kocuria sp.]|uniref:SDR family oxidoreductase n=1 Tax=Kocuria sp. TaxID=1871328 RepID=UPI0026DCE5A6|nr:SDR family oxidoreductase [Kocuria sp.]MDO4918991.1 SDR family oxidoreductase [Kocuria sp.]
MSTVYTVPDQSGRRFLVTGANSGLGREVTRRLAKAGAGVVMACRSQKKAEAARQEILSEVPGADLEIAPLDLADLGSVHALAESIESSGRGLDVLVNNAGVMMPPERMLTTDGHELQWGSNFLGHFVLTNLLLPVLLRSTTPRVTTMTSLAAKTASIDFADLESTRKYSSQGAYGQSKLGNLLMGLHLARVSRERGWGLVSTTAHPGFTSTNLQSAGPSLGSGRSTLATRVMSLGVLPFMETPQGASPELMAATDPHAANGGFYGPDGRLGITGDATQVPVYRSAQGPTLAESLWAVAARETGVDLPRP